VEGFTTSQIFQSSAGLLGLLMSLIVFVSRVGPVLEPGVVRQNHQVRKRGQADECGVGYLELLVEFFCLLFGQAIHVPFTPKWGLGFRVMRRMRRF
jgi:hypothetical protein